MTGTLRLDPSTGLLRGVRAGVLTVPTVGTAVLGHAAVDGCSSAFAVFVAAGLCWPAAVALLARQRRLPALLGWVLGAQLLSHAVLSALCGDGGQGGQGGLAGHVLATATPAMLTAHFAAALVTGAVLARADAGLWVARGLLRAAGRLLHRPRAVLPAPSSPAPRPAARRVVPPAQVAQTVPSRRGPPVPVALAS